MMTNSRFKNIDFLRVLALFAIMFVHIFSKKGNALYALFSDNTTMRFLKSCVIQANMAVEIFFVISGFLFLFKLNKSEKLMPLILKKYFRFLPMLLVSIVICFIGKYFHAFKFNITENLPYLILMNNFIISTSKGTNVVLWYVSVLMSCFILYFWLYQKCKHPIIGSVFLILTAYILLELLRSGNYDKPHYNIYGFLNVGFLRGVGAFGIGSLIAFFYKNFDFIEHNKLNVWQKAALSAVEMFLFVLILMWLFYPHKRLNGFVFVILFSTFFILFVYKKGVISNFFEKQIWSVAAQYTYCIYAIHCLLFKIVNTILWKKHPSFVYLYPSIAIIFDIVIVCILGILIYHIIERPMLIYFKKFFSDRSKTV